MSRPPSNQPAGRPGPRPLRAFFVSLLLSAFGLAMLLVGDRGTAEWQKAQEESRSLKSQIAALEAENSDLARRIADAETNDFQAEKHARENLGLVKPDEVVFVLADPKAAR
jgi:cell division protein FtsB